MEMGIDTSPYENGVSPLIPISIWGSKWNGYCTHLYGDPHRDGSLFPNGYGSVTNPFPNRVSVHLGIEVKITIWECFPYGDHRFHMVITVRKWAGRLKYSHMGCPCFRIEFVSIWGLTYIPYEGIFSLDHSSEDISLIKKISSGNDYGRAMSPRESSAEVEVDLAGSHSRLALGTESPLRNSCFHSSTKPTSQDSLDSCSWLLECLTAACKALSLANAKGEGTNGLVIRSLDD